MTTDSRNPVGLDPAIVDAMQRGAVVPVEDRVQPAAMPLAALPVMAQAFHPTVHGWRLTASLWVTQPPSRGDLRIS